VIAPPTIRTDRLVLRGLYGDDTDAFLRYFQSDRARFTGGPKSARDAWRHLAADLGHWALRGFGMFAVTRTGNDAIIGMIGHWYPLGWAEPEIGYLLFDAADEGQGLASEGVRACIDHAYGPLGWDTAVSYIDPDNSASIRLAERMGAVRDDAASQPQASHPVVIYRHRTPA